MQRVLHFEIMMQEAKCLQRSGENPGRLQLLISELESYYTSEEWKQDFEADEAGLLPKKLPRGVLSEDGVYSLLEDHCQK